MTLRSFIPNRFLRYAFIGVPLLLIAVFSFWYHRAPLDILQQHDQWYLRVTLDHSYPTPDQRNDPQTTVLQFDSTGLRYRYRLIDTLQSFSKVELLRKDGKPFDLSDYDEIELEAQASQGKCLPIELLTLEFLSQDSIQRIYNAAPEVSPERQEIKVPVAELQTPRWWYGKQGLHESALSKQDLSQVISIGFNNDKLYLKHDGAVLYDEVKIHRFRLLRSWFPVYVFSAVWIILGALLFFLLWAFKRKNEPPLIIPYHQVQIPNRDKKETEEAIAYLQAHFRQQELTVTDVQTATGIHERRISVLLKKETSLNFKQYLNSLRLTEAKALLKSAELPVSEIAFKVGYSNVTHFNKVFKAEEGCSPTEYRDQCRNSN